MSVRAEADNARATVGWARILLTWAQCSRWAAWVLIWLKSSPRLLNDNKLNTSDNASNYQSASPAAHVRRFTRVCVCVRVWGWASHRWASSGVAGVVNTINEFQLVVLASHNQGPALIYVLLATPRQRQAIVRLQACVYVHVSVCEWMVKTKLGKFNEFMLVASLL